jgi:hypothetical protein
VGMIFRHGSRGIFQRISRPVCVRTRGLAFPISFSMVPPFAMKDIPVTRPAPEMTL